MPIEWADSASWPWCNDVKWCGTALEGSGTTEGEKVLSNIYSGVIWLNGVWSWQPKFLVGQALVTVGGSFCQERCMDNHKTVRGTEWKWTTDRHDIRKESEKVDRQFIAQWSKKRERWKALTWVKLRVIDRKRNRNTKVCWSGRNWTSWKVNNTGGAFEATILRSEKWMRLVQTLTFYGLPSLIEKVFLLFFIRKHKPWLIIGRFNNVVSNYSHCTCHAMHWSHCLHFHRHVSCIYEIQRRTAAQLIIQTHQILPYSWCAFIASSL